MVNTISPEHFDHLVRKFYGFLETEFGFVIHKIDSQKYEIKSPSTKIIILVEGDALTVGIEPIGEGASQLLRQNISPSGVEIYVVVECLEPNFHYKVTTISGNRWIHDIPVELEERAKLLQKYCSNFLKGDYSQWMIIPRCLSERHKRKAI